MPNEIAIKEIQVNYKLPVITFDVTPLKEQISKITKQYTDWVVKEEDISAAKDISAAMNNTAKSISDKRIAIVKEIKKPIDEFENTLKALTQELKDTASSIKTQIDEYTEAERESKRAQVKTIPDWANYMTFDEKWLNKSTSWETINKDIAVQKTLFQTNVALVMAKCELYGLNPDKYVNALIGRQDVNGILNQINNDHEVKREYTEPEPIISVEEKPKEIRFNFVVEIVGTKNDFDLVKAFMTNNGIKYKEI
jgi:hypothetical protein